MTLIGYLPYLEVDFTFHDSNNPAATTWGREFIGYIQKNGTTDKLRCPQGTIDSSTLTDGSSHTVRFRVTPGQSYDGFVALSDGKGGETPMVPLFTNYTVAKVASGDPVGPIWSKLHHLPIATDPTNGTWNGTTGTFDRTVHHPDFTGTINSGGGVNFNATGHTGNLPYVNNDTGVKSTINSGGGVNFNATGHTGTLPRANTHSSITNTVLSAGGIDFSSNLHTNKTLDNIGDTATYAKVKSSELSSGTVKQLNDGTNVRTAAHVAGAIDTSSRIVGNIYDGTTALTPANFTSVITSAGTVDVSKPKAGVTLPRSAHDSSFINAIDTSSRLIGSIYDGVTALSPGNVTSVITTSGTVDVSKPKAGVSLPRSAHDSSFINAIDTSSRLIGAIWDGATAISPGNVTNVITNTGLVKVANATGILPYGNHHASVTGSLNSGSDTYGSYVKQGQIHGGSVFQSGSGGGHNLLFNPTFANGTTGWDTGNLAGTTVSTDSLAGGRLLVYLNSKTNVTAFVQQLVTCQYGNQPMVVQCIIECSTLPSDTTVYLRVTDGVGNALGASGITGGTGGHNFVSCPFTSPSNGQVYVQAFITTGATASANPAVFYKFQLEYGDVPTYWVDHNSNALLTTIVNKDGSSAKTTDWLPESGTNKYAAEHGADITGNHTSNDTAHVNGVAASSISPIASKMPAEAGADVTANHNAAGTGSGGNARSAANLAAIVGTDNAMPSSAPLKTHVPNSIANLTSNIAVQFYSASSGSLVAWITSNIATSKSPGGSNFPDWEYPDGSGGIFPGSANGYSTVNGTSQSAPAKYWNGSSAVSMSWTGLGTSGVYILIGYNPAIDYYTIPYGPSATAPGDDVVAAAQGDGSVIVALVSASSGTLIHTAGGGGQPISGGGGRPRQ